MIGSNSNIITNLIIPKSCARHVLVYFTMTTIEIDVEEYIEMLEARRKYVTSNYGWGDMPDCLWDYAMDVFRDCGVDPKKSSPKYIVDNMLVNGDYGEFEEHCDWKWHNGYRDPITGKFMSRDDYKEQWVSEHEDDMFYINADEEVWCNSL